MASVFKPKRTVTDPATGKTKRVPYACWYIKYRDGDGIVRKVKGFTDKAATLQRAAELERKAQLKQAGLSDPFEAHKTRPLAEHLEAFRRSLASKGNCERHVQETFRRLETAFGACQFLRLNCLDAGQYADWLHERRQAGLSIASSNHYVTAAKTFGTWLVKDRRSAQNPFVHLTRLNIATDRRVERRAISAEQFQHLITTTAHSSATFRGLTGAERSLLYLNCGLTGLRCSEAAALSMQSFDLQAAQPTVTLLAKTTKNRRADVLPVHPALAAALRPWFAQKRSNHIAESAPLWPGTWPEKAAKMLRGDLAAAGIDFEDAAGHRFDFHSLRGQFISQLGRSGVAVQVAQKLARHSDPRLTANHYTHLGVADLASAVGMICLPTATSPAEPIVLRATGTDAPAILRGPQWDHSGAVSCVFVPTADDTEPVTLPLSTNAETPENPGFCENSQGILKAPPAGFEPATDRLEICCSIQLSYGGK